MININNKQEKLQEILLDYSGLPEYSEMPVPEVNSKSLFGDYPIPIAAVRGAIEDISLLLDNGADVNAPGEHGYTPLHDAVEQGHLSAVQFLLSRGANVSSKSDDGITPLELAELLDEKEIYSFLHTVKTDLLLKEINDVFPTIPMPSPAESTVHQNDCEPCDDVPRYFDIYRDSKIDTVFIRYMHKNLYQLSPLGFLWLLPHYLKYCLSNEWCYAEELVYFLVYHLSPSPQFENDAYIRFSELNAVQIQCLISFLNWCNETESYYDSEEDTHKAFTFLKKLLSKQT